MVGSGPDYEGSIGVVWAGLCWYERRGLHWVMLVGMVGSGLDYVARNGGVWAGLCW